MEVKVSLIIPVYGVENYLERAVDSALAQTLEEKEVILVDDGSPDACPQICDRYAAGYPGVVRVLHQENQGLGMARNAGAALAQGEYLLFLDSDDTIQPEMAQALYEKAKAGDCDLVMCDVRILYVEENREVVVASYPREEVDLADYIAHGNNITYSVNKLFRRSLWQENRYEKMLFEDIALIPAVVTRCRRVGYVPQAFYNYYRRGGTISTTQTGDMVDIVKAFRKFLLTCHPAYRQEAVYSTARQLLWNMTQSRPLFLPDFIGLLHEFEADFRLNPYLKEDRETAKLLGYLDTPVVPDVLICAHCRRELPPELREAIGRHFPLAERLRDFLITRFGFQMNGRRQTREGVTVHLPSVLCYDFHDGENCCKRNLPAPEGFEVVSGPALELWSQRLLENWNLYKAERQRKAPAGKAPPKAAGGFTQAQLEAEGRRVAQLYESSTSWKVTKPLRALAGLWKGKAGHAGQPEQ